MKPRTLLIVIIAAVLGVAAAGAYVRRRRAAQAPPPAQIGTDDGVTHIFEAEDPGVAELRQAALEVRRAFQTGA